jgi:hypothetical protein
MNPTCFYSCIAAAYLFLTGCKSTHDANGNRMLSLALKCAQTKGYDLNKYKVAGVSSDAREYMVMFTGLEAKPGNFFTVYIDRVTSDCFVVPGR